jgi:hypothetical protein
VSVRLSTLRIVPFFKRPRAVEPPTRTPQFIGRAKEPLPADVVEALAAACADDGRVAAAYLYCSMLALQGEAPHHTVGLVLNNDVEESEHRQVTDAIYRQCAELLGHETVDFQILNDRSIVSVQAAVPPTYERHTSSA